MAVASLAVPSYVWPVRLPSVIVAVALLTFCDNAVEVLFACVLLPAYVAVIEWVPTARLEVESKALPPLRALMPSDVVPLKNSTLPVASLGVTVAVKVTDSAYWEGFLLEFRAVVVACLVTLT